MRFVLLLASAICLAGCASIRFNPHDPRTPDTVAGQAAAEHQRTMAETICGSEGRVTQRDDTDGTRAGDWNCERRKR